MVLVIWYYTPIRSKPLYMCGAEIVWSLAICYIVFACYHYGGPINCLLSFPLWQPLARLSFISFLIHPTVFQFMDTNMKHGDYLSNYGFVRKSRQNYSYLIIFNFRKFIDSVPRIRDCNDHCHSSLSSYLIAFWNADNCFGTGVLECLQEYSEWKAKERAG